MAAKKPMATKATQKQYDKTMKSYGKLTDENNKRRMDKLTKPSKIVDAAKKTPSKGPMATKKLGNVAKAGRAGLVGLAGMAGYAAGTALNKKYKISDKIVEGTEKVRDALKKRKSMKERAKAMRKGK